jgi:hypothetical protein
MAESTITAKEQTTVPADVSALVQAKPGTKLVWSVAARWDRPESAKHANQIVQKALTQLGRTYRALRRYAAHLQQTAL